MYCPNFDIWNNCCQFDCAKKCFNDSKKLSVSYCVPFISASSFLSLPLLSITNKSPVSLQSHGFQLLLCQQRQQQQTESWLHNTKQNQQEQQQTTNLLRLSSKSSLLLSSLSSSFLSLLLSTLLFTLLSIITSTIPTSALTSNLQLSLNIEQQGTNESNKSFIQTFINENRVFFFLFNCIFQFFDYFYYWPSLKFFFFKSAANLIKLAALKPTTKLLINLISFIFPPVYWLIKKIDGEECRNSSDWRCWKWWWWLRKRRKRKIKRKNIHFYKFVHIKLKLQYIFPIQLISFICSVYLTTPTVVAVDVVGITTTTTTTKSTSAISVSETTPIETETFQNYLNSLDRRQTNENYSDNDNSNNVQRHYQHNPIYNPFLRHQRQVDQIEQENLCHIWYSHSPTDLCSRGRWARLRLMRKISLFSRDCDSPASNMQLGELFQLEWTTIKSESDLIAHSEQLKSGVEGRDCVLGGARSDKCTACFQRLHNALDQVDKAYTAFERTLQRFDCLLAVDSSTATRPFSPNGTCIDCKIWYRKWLLVHLVNIWRDPPCINWCYYTQLACPHFGTSKVVDFAGHPAFLCRDLNIPHSNTGSNENDDGIQSCNCVHPCDLQRGTQHHLPLANTVNYYGVTQSHDFYASPEHCYARRKRCRAKFGYETDERTTSIHNYATT